MTARMGESGEDAMAEDAAVEVGAGAAGAAPADNGQGIEIARHFRLHYNQPLPHLDSPGAAAVTAVDTRFPTRNVFALLMEPNQLIRGDVLSVLSGQPAQNWLGLVAADIFDVPGSGGRRFAVVIERPEGQRLWPTMSSPGDPIPEVDLTRFIVPALADALNDLGGRRAIHGSVRPDNIFYIEKGHGQVVLGECISGPPSASQPAAFVPIDHGFASPLARGDGSPESDLYALGATLLALLLGRNPAGDRDDATLLRDKQIQGSFVALVGDIPIATMSNHMRSLLRGLLTDDIEYRWTPEQVLEWCENPRINARRTPAPRRSPRPFGFAGQDFYYACLFPAAFASNRSEAMRVLQDGSLAKWLRAELHDAATDEKLAQAVTEAANNDETLLALSSMALDPAGPLRYRDLVVMPDGLGPLLAEAFARRDNDRLKAIADLILSELPGHWVECHGGSSNQLSIMMRTLEEQAGFLRQTTFGFGPERCLYEMNPGLPCRSPLVAQDYVRNVADLMIALDRAAARGIDGGAIIDRHIAAFIASHNARNTVFLRRVVKAGEAAAESPLASLSLLARVQIAEKVGPLRNLAAWWRTRLTPVIRTFHSSIRREVITEHLDAAAKTGSLAKLLHAVDGASVRDQDEIEYAAAKREYASNGEEIDYLARSGGDRAEAAISFGHQMAAGLGALVLASSLVYFALTGVS
jgi:hypothetical protein